MKKILVLLLLSVSLFASVGKIAVIYGGANIERGGKTIQATASMELEEKDVIKTLTEARLQLIFSDNTIISLGQETLFSIDDFINEQNREPKVKFGVAQGIFKSITGQIGKANPEKFTVETKTSTIGIRGTTFGGTVTNTGDTIGCTEGKISVTEKVTGISVEVPKGTLTSIVIGTPPAPPVPITPADMKKIDPDQSQSQSSQNRAQGERTSTQSEQKPKENATQTESVAQTPPRKS